MNPERAEQFRRLLLERREQLIWAREGMASQRESLGELSMYDNHPADLGTETWERSKDLGLRSRAGQALADVEAALRRLAEGTYGYCQVCGHPIEADRLAALPETPYCRSCAEQIQDAERRPVEEEVLGPPFARSWRDQEDYAAFEGEDAWQAVAQYGTSESPSDVPGAKGYPNVVEDADEDRGSVGVLEDRILDPRGRED